MDVSYAVIEQQKGRDEVDGQGSDSRFHLSRCQRAVPWGLMDKNSPADPEERAPCSRSSNPGPTHHPFYPLDDDHFDDRAVITSGDMNYFLNLIFTTSSVMAQKIASEAILAHLRCPTYIFPILIVLVP